MNYNIEKMPLSINIDGANKNIKDDVKKKIFDSQKGRCLSCKVKMDIDAHYQIIGDNIVSLCSLCYYPLNLNEVTTGKDSIILIPEISQLELNALQRALEITRFHIESTTKLIEEGKKVGETYEIEELKATVDIINIILKERADFTDTYYSVGSSDVDIVASGLQKLKKEEYEKRAVGLYGLRLFHDMSKYQDQLKIWAVDYNKYRFDNWRKLITETVKKMNKTKMK